MKTTTAFLFLTLLLFVSIFNVNHTYAADHCSSEKELADLALFWLDKHSKDIAHMREVYTNVLIGNVQVVKIGSNSAYCPFRIRFQIYMDETSSFSPWGKDITCQAKKNDFGESTIFCDI